MYSTATNADLAGLDHLHQRARLALRKAAQVVGVKAVHILGRQDAFDDLGGVEVGRQGELHQNAINLVIGIQGVDHVQQRGV